MHSVHAAQTHRAIGKTNERAQKPRRRAGIAHVNFQRCLHRAGVGHAPAEALHGEMAIARLGGILRHRNRKAQ